MFSSKIARSLLATVSVCGGCQSSGPSVTVLPPCLWAPAAPVDAIPPSSRNLRAQVTPVDEGAARSTAALVRNSGTELIYRDGWRTETQRELTDYSPAMTDLMTTAVQFVGLEVSGGDFLCLRSRVGEASVCRHRLYGQAELLEVDLPNCSVEQLSTVDGRLFALCGRSRTPIQSPRVLRLDDEFAVEQEWALSDDANGRSVRITREYIVVVTPRSSVQLTHVVTGVTREMRLPSGVEGFVAEAVVVREGVLLLWSPGAPLLLLREPWGDAALGRIDVPGPYDTLHLVGDGSPVLVRRSGLTSQAWRLRGELEGCSR